MARTFASASSEVITLSLGALGFAFGPGTMAFIGKAASDAAVKYGLNAGTANTTNVSLGLNASNVVSCSMGNSARAGSTTVVAADGWFLLGMSKATGTVLPRFHIYKYGTNTWVHENAGSSIANVTPAVAAHLSGQKGSTNFWNGDIAVAGFWNVVLTDAQFEAIAFSLPPWFAPAQPKGLWILDQSAVGQLVPDLSGGGANQSAITGTAVSANSVPIWTPYGTHTPQ